MEQKKKELKEYIKRLILMRKVDDEELVDRIFLLLEEFIKEEIRSQLDK